MRPFLLGILLLVATFSFASPSPGSLRLTSGWAIQSSCKVEEKGDVISIVQFHPSDWYKASVPGGVLANLVADKVYPEPYRRMNVRQIPGATYPVGTLFANQPMPDDSPFKCSWWYRLEFSVDSSHPGKTGSVGPLEQKWLHFDGINYPANIWLNYKLIASNGCLPGIRVQRHRRARKREERAGGGSVRADGERSRHQLGGLEPYPAR